MEANDTTMPDFDLNDAGLRALCTPALDPLFWPLARLGVGSAWCTHVPFAHWVVAALRPAVLVELGTHNGVSYSAFCEAVMRSRLDTRCYAVDTWQGDEHAHYYGEEVYADFRRFHDGRYSGFSELLRSRFDDALPTIADGSIDLLHIDGLHTYDAVSHDFEAWRPKLSRRAVVLLHDTNVRSGDFGVWRLWQELSGTYPGFEFLHGHGLGVLAVGEDVPAAVASLARLDDSATVAALRERFARLGERWDLDLRERLLQDRIRADEAQREAAAAEASDRLHALERRAEELGQRAAASEQVRAAAVTELDQARAAAVTELDQVRAAAAAEAEWLRREVAGLRAERQLLLASTSWRITAPLRTLMARTPHALRRTGKQVVRVYRTEGAAALLHRVWRNRHRLGLAARPAPSLEPQAASGRTRETAEKQRLEASIRVVFISGEPETPGHIYRVERYAAAALAAGAQASWMRLDEIPGRVSEIGGASLLVIWRAAWDDNVAHAVAAARAAGARVVFDVDDLMIEPTLARVEVIDGIRSQNLTEEQVRGHYERCNRTMEAADYCTAPTEELAARMRRWGKPALVLPNGFDEAAWRASRQAVRRRAGAPDDGFVRIGYAGGSRTHQRDFALVAAALGRVLRARPQVRLVLFRAGEEGPKLLDLAEFPALAGLDEQVEWRNLVKLPDLPAELARLDVNLAPLEVGNVFCEAKSELKFFEAALVDVPTIASPTGPFSRALRDGETGFLAETPSAWHDAILALVDDPALRRRIGRAAQHAALAAFGPLRRCDQMAGALPLLLGEPRAAARAFELQLRRGPTPSADAIAVPESEVVFAHDRGGSADVAVVVPLYNYAGFIADALNSVAAQTLTELDLVVVDDCSTDDSLSVAVRWAEQHTARFNRILVLRNRANSGLGPTRNTGIDAADTPFVLPLDADNRLLPTCCAACLQAIRSSNAAFSFPLIRQFGEGREVIGNYPFEPGRFISGNYIDAMALVSRQAWAAVGGYGDFRLGWEDFDFWCRMVERGLWGLPVAGAPLAEYRVHGSSMLRTTTNAGANLGRLIDSIEERHPWLCISRPEAGDTPARPPQDRPGADERLAALLPILRCPETGGALELTEEGTLRSADGTRTWKLVAGRPNLFPGMDAPELQPESHISNHLPESALTLIHACANGGRVLNLSAGGTVERFDHVVEVEAAVFRHTDIIGNAQHLPFIDGAFDAAVVLNAFEHYRDPLRVAAELRRVLRPGGRLLVRTAFLQPLHEAPWHFYNCTRYGLENWFADFETERLDVSDNFSPGHSVAWIASACEAALREADPAAADAFMAAPLGRFVSLWRGPEALRPADPSWAALARLPQAAQEAIAAGFEYVGRRPEE
jgi:glycosyltransferase involved in cell wall biosynthesis/SAM-dependent methyltransferase